MADVLNDVPGTISAKDSQQDAAIKELAQVIQILVQHLKKTESDLAEVKKQLEPKPRKPRKKKEPAPELLVEEVK